MLTRNVLLLVQNAHYKTLMIMLVAIIKARVKHNHTVTRALAARRGLGPTDLSPSAARSTAGTSRISCKLWTSVASNIGDLLPI